MRGLILVPYKWEVGMGVVRGFVGNRELELRRDVCKMLQKAIVRWCQG